MIELILDLCVFYVIKQIYYNQSFESEFIEAIEKL